MKSRFLFFLQYRCWQKKGLAFIEARENVSFIEHMHSKTVKTPQPALERSERAKGEVGGKPQQANK
jgi:hypothetical protein